MDRANADVLRLTIFVAILLGTGTAAIVLGAGAKFINILCRNMGGMEFFLC